MNRESQLLLILLAVLSAGAIIIGTMLLVPQGAALPGNKPAQDSINSGQHSARPASGVEGYPKCWTAHKINGVWYVRYTYCWWA